MKIVCVGDSNTLGYDPRSYLGEQYPDSSKWTSMLASKLDAVVINEGENGRTVRDLSRIKTCECDCLILMLGTNDILEGRSAQETSRRFGETLANHPIPAKRTVLIAPPALKSGVWISDFNQIAQSQRLAQEYSQLAEAFGFYFVNAIPWKIPLCYDGVHFTESGHLHFAAYLAERILDILRQF